MKKRIFTTMALVCCFVVCFAVIANVSGKWSAVFNAPDGNAYPLTFDFKLNGNQVTGTIDAAGMTVPIDSGKVEGDNISFSATIQGVVYAHKGKYYSAADSVGLDVTFSGNKNHMTLTRPK